MSRFSLLLMLLLAAAAHAAPAMMLASPWQTGTAVEGWLFSEKLDGVRARWDGTTLWSRGGAPIAVPAGFTAGWPAQPLDGELWLGRGLFEQTSALVRGRRSDDPRWQQLHFWAFDLPADPGRFEDRADRLAALLRRHPSVHLRLVAQQPHRDEAALQAHLQHVLGAGGEGLIAHHRHARYQAGRSPLLRKLKPWHDAEATVLAHQAGQGKYRGQLGALLVQGDDGVRFAIGSGLSDAQRRQPPPPGSRITYRYTELTGNGRPRFPRLLRIRDDEPAGRR
jgi:DNA ligase-1